MATFKKAERKQIKLKLGIMGVSGSGKTYSALRLATGLANGGKIALLDTENGSASLYSEKFNFDVLDIKPPFEDTDKFLDGIRQAEKEGYEVLIIDSATHFWEGVLAYKEKLDSTSKTNSFTNWGKAGQKYKDGLNLILQSKMHIISCMRSKMEYQVDRDEKTGKSTPRKIGLAPVMREGSEYEFTTVFDVALNHNTEVSKDRTGLFTDKIFQITEETGKQILDWINSGKAVVEEPEPIVTPPPAPTIPTQQELIDAVRVLTMTSPCDEVEVVVALRLYLETIKKTLAPEITLFAMLNVNQLQYLQKNFDAIIKHKLAVDDTKRKEEDKLPV